MLPSPTMADVGNEPAEPTWRELAIARSLDPARVRAEKRVQRFLDAALELMTSSPGKDFTVQEVVERSGQSLRSFYQYLPAKYELLLALFEESVRAAAEQLRTAIGDEPDPLARLRTFTIECYRACAPPPKGKAAKRGPGPALAGFAQQLLTEHPKEAARAFVPVVGLLEEILDDAAAAGVIRSDVNIRRTAGVVLHAVMFNAFATTISGTARSEGDPAEELWTLLLDGLGVRSR
jgi:AcrR family transcriptional regulator